MAMTHRNMRRDVFAGTWLHFAHRTVAPAAVRLATRANSGYPRTTAS
jgi:hypothetical protein